MKLKLSSIANGIMYFLILCNLSIVKILPIFTQTTVSWINLSASIGLLLLLLIFKKGSAIPNYYVKMIVLLVVFISAEGISTVIRYNYSVSNTFYAGFRWAFLLLAPFVFCTLKHISFHKILNFIAFGIALSSLMRIILSWYYGLTGVYLFSDMAFEFNAENWIRNGVLRVNMPWLLALFPALWFWLFDRRRKKAASMLYIAELVIVVYYVVFILQARAIILYQAASFIMIWLIKRKSSLKQLVLVFILLMAGIAFINSDYFTNLLNSFFNDTALGGAASHRLQTIDWFFSKFASNPLFGAGMLVDADLHAGLESGHITDIGILGGIFQYGLCGIVVYFFFFGRWIKVAATLRKMGDENSLLAIGMIWCILLFEINIHCFASARMAEVPFISAIFEYLLYQSKMKNPESACNDGRRYKLV